MPNKAVKRSEKNGVDRAVPQSDSVVAHSVLERVINPERGNLTPALARHVLSLDFPPSDHKRYLELSEKAQEGTLSQDERAELQDYLNVNEFLTMLKAKAQSALRRKAS